MCGRSTEELLQREREARNLDAKALQELEMEMAAKRQELEEKGTELHTTDQLRVELEKELEDFKIDHENQVEQVYLEKDERESELQAKLHSIEMKTKEQEIALLAERKVRIDILEKQLFGNNNHI